MFVFLDFRKFKLNATLSPEYNDQHENAKKKVVAPKNTVHSYIVKFCFYWKLGFKINII